MFVHFLASHGHLFFHIKCKIIQFSKTIEILIENSLNMSQYGQSWHICKIKSSLARTRYVFPFVQPWCSPLIKFYGSFFKKKNVKQNKKSNTTFSSNTIFNLISSSPFSFNSDNHSSQGKEAGMAFELNSKRMSQ